MTDAQGRAGGCVRAPVDRGEARGPGRPPAGGRQPLPPDNRKSVLPPRLPGRIVPARRGGGRGGARDIAGPVPVGAGSAAPPILRLVFLLRLLLAVALAGLAAGAAVAAGPGEEVDPADAVLTVTIDALAPKPFLQEMILVRVHGTYTVTITLEQLEQPPFQGFAWMQLGRDKWGEAEVAGRKVRTFDRVMAIFPDHAGPLRIDPFRHHLTLLADDGHRFRYDVVSAPVAIEVLPPPETLVARGDWWLPARSLQLTDGFDREPDALGPGETARRTVTLVAEGIGADLLPPMPKLRSAAVSALPEPEERSTKMTSNGPVSTVVWRWVVRPVKGDTGDFASVDIPWFDTVRRTAAHVTIGARRVALASSETTVRSASGHWLQHNRPMVVAAAGVLGFGLAGLLLLGRLRFVGLAELRRRLQPWLPDPDLRAIRRAGRTGDIATLRTAARRYATRRDGDSGKAFSRELAALDATMFGPAGGQGVDVGAWARRLVRAAG